MQSFVAVCCSLLFTLVSPLVRAQCSSEWRAAPLGFNQDVMSTMMWDQDGSGPVPARLVIGVNTGSFGSSFFVHSYDPALGTLVPLGSAFSGAFVSCFCRASNGDLIAGGSFNAVGSATINNVARWDGTSWTQLGPGISGIVYAVLELANGDIVVGGAFSVPTATGVASNIARLSGGTWSPFGLGTNGTVRCLTVFNGDLLVGGSFTNAGGVVANRIARWNGAGWASLGVGVASGSNVSVYAMVATGAGPTSQLVVGGTFLMAGGLTAQGVASWNGTTWGTLGGLISSGPFGSGAVRSLVVGPSGELVAGGNSFSALPTVVRWVGGAWQGLGAGPGTFGGVQTLSLLPNGDMAAGGDFLSADHSSDRIARWNSTKWQSLGSTVNDSVSAVLGAASIYGSDTWFAGGNFTSIGGVSANRVARYSPGYGWNGLGTGTNGPVGALAIVGSPGLSDLIVGGTFTSVDGFPNSNIARYQMQGGYWVTSMGSGVNNSVYALAVLPSGEVVVGGAFTTAGGQTANRVAKWSGSGWTTLGAGMNGVVLSLLATPTGDLYAGGTFTSPGNNVARWNGTAWVALGAGVQTSVHCLAMLPNGRLVVGGDFTSAGGAPAAYIAQWDGSGWQSLGSGMTPAGSNWGVLALETLPNGDLLAGGWFSAAGGNSAPFAARWNGAAWSSVAGGLTSYVSDFATLSNGDVAAGGGFTIPGGNPSPNLAILSTSCPAYASSYGVACAGSGGVNTLTPLSLPWAGSTFKASAVGMPSLGLILSVYGFSQLAIPIASVIPQGLPGCTAYVSPDFTNVLLPAFGGVTTELALPNASAIAGIMVHHYVVPFELDPAFQLTAVTSSNALSLTMGFF